MKDARTPNDGGPAFPCDWKDFQPNTGIQVVREQYEGMSLRDWFAGMALQGLLAMCAGEGVNPGTADKVAEVAYEHADAMLKERLK